MARILNLARQGHPILSAPCEKVADPTSAETKEIIEDMLATMEHLAPITGLAAPQVFIPKRIAIFHIPASRSRGTSDVDVPLTIMINPKVEILTEEQYLDWEGCLSLPDFIGEVPRYDKIRYHFTTPEGERITRDAEAHHARAVQHECDHLNGVLYPERMDNLARLGYAEEMRKYHLN